MVCYLPFFAFSVLVGPNNAQVERLSEKQKIPVFYRLSLSKTKGLALKLDFSLLPSFLPPVRKVYARWTGTERIMRQNFGTSILLLCPGFVLPCRQFITRCIANCGRISRRKFNRNCLYLFPTVWYALFWAQLAIHLTLWCIRKNDKSN